MEPHPHSIGYSLRAAARYLGECGIEDAQAEAEFLLANVLGISRTKLLADAKKKIPESERLKFNRFVARRGEQREPLAYIVGTAEFFGLRLEVSPLVMIPRPSTETLVQCALDRLPSTGTFLDLGTGSGAAAIAVLKHARRAMAVATDLDPRALELAERNARAHGVSERIVFVSGDLFAPLGDDCFDLIVTNPPYVREAELKTLAPEIAHEPRLSLSGGPDGLGVIRRILAEAKPHLVAGGRLLVEIGAGQAGAAREIALRSGFASVHFMADLDGIDRVLDAW